MSIIDSFDISSEAIFKPENSVKRLDNFPETVIVTFRSEIIEEVIKKHNANIIDKIRAGFNIPIYKFDYEKRDFAIIQTLVGGAASGGIVEELIVKDAKKILFFGSCGSLDRNISVGHLIIPTEAYRDEGLSYHYMPAGDYVKIKTAEDLAQIMEELNFPYIKARVWTTDAVYRETVANMNKRRAEGCIAVDMECASIMSVGNFRNIPIYQFLYAEDNLDATEWESRSMWKVSQNEYENYLNIALRIAIKLQEEK